jgi:hypothetical protein
MSGDKVMQQRGPIAFVNYDSLKAYQQIANVVSVTATGDAEYDHDFMLVDSTAGAISITLPLARNGVVFCIVRVAGANNVTILPTGSDTINGGASVVISTSNAPQTFKAFTPLITGYVRIA